MKNKMKFILLWFLLSLQGFTIILGLCLIQYPPLIKDLSYTDHDAISIDSNDDFNTLGFPGSGTENDPYRIENLHIDTDDIDGIYITGTTDYFVIQNCIIDSEDYGVYFKNIYGTGIIKNNIVGQTMTNSFGIWQCEDILIENNTVSPSCYYGIQVHDCINTVIKNNDCTGADGPGIEIDNGDNTQIINNICSYNNDGIYVANSNKVTINDNKCFECEDQGITVDNSENIIISANECYDNDDDGIQIISSQWVKVTSNSLHSNGLDGIEVETSSGGNRIFHNEIYSNSVGIRLDDTTNTLVTYNLIQSNTLYGVSINAGTSSNTFYCNTFKFNGDGTEPQADDSDGTATWYNATTKEGNFWSDWIGSGSYEIAGPPGTEDPYPLSKDPLLSSTTTSATDTTETSATDTTKTSTTDKTDEDGEPNGITPGFELSILFFAHVCCITLLIRKFVRRSEV